MLHAGGMCGGSIGNARMGSPAGSAGSGLYPVDGVVFLVCTNPSSGLIGIGGAQVSGDPCRLTKGKSSVEIGEIQS